MNVFPDFVRWKKFHRRVTNEDNFLHRQTRRTNGFEEGTIKTIVNFNSAKVKLGFGIRHTKMENAIQSNESLNIINLSHDFALLGQSKLKNFQSYSLFTIATSLFNQSSRPHSTIPQPTTFCQFPLI